MAYHIYDCQVTNPQTTNENLCFLTPGYQALYMQGGFKQASYSTSNGTVAYSHSCAHSNWAKNTKVFRISMDNALRNAVNSKLNSGGLINLQPYLINEPEFAGFDMNGGRDLQIYGYLCTTRSITGSFDVTQSSYWEGDWPINFPTSVNYSYDIPGLGRVSDTIMVISHGWYTRGDARNIIVYPKNVFNYQTMDYLTRPKKDWYASNQWDGTYYSPFPASEMTYGKNDTRQTTLSYYTIEGIYSRNAGTRHVYSDNAADVILDADSTAFSGLNLSKLMTYVGAPNKRTYIGSRSTILNNIILSISNVNFANNYIEVKFAIQHDSSRSMVAFVPDFKWGLCAFRLNYNYPITSITRPVDNWGMTFHNDSSFNPTLANGTGTSAMIWDSVNNAVVFTAGSFVNNSNGYSKIISRTQGTLQCSCSNVNNTVRLTIAGFTITIPSTSQFTIRVLAVNNGSIGFWTISPPGIGLTHSFSITYPQTSEAPIVSFENELYTAIAEALDQPGVPFPFFIMAVTDQYTAEVSGMVRADLVAKNGKRYFSVAIYDVNGNFHSLMVKNGMYVTVPLTITVDCQLVNNEVLVKAGIASIGFTSTSVGAMAINADAIAVLLPVVASISKNGARIGYATTTVNQNTFAFSFSAQQNEVNQTDDFVTHYLG